LFDERWAETTIAHLREIGVDVGPGLTEAQLAAGDAAFGVPLPRELRLLLAAGVPTGRRWARWSEGAEVVAADARAHLDHIFCVDIVENGYWCPRFGDRPADDERAVDQARAAVRAAPPLIPLYAHRFLTTMAVGPRPVLSVWAPHDTVRCGADLATYLAQDHRIPGPAWVPEPDVPVPFWEDVFEDI
jgi:hypothetical protein